MSFPVTEFSTSPVTIVAGVCFVGALLVASITDVRSRRIPNRLVLGLVLLGLVYSAAVMPVGTGLARALLSFGIGFALWIPFYALRMLGAGDVKLFAAAAAWISPSQVVSAALLSAVVGGALSIVGLILAHGFGLTSFRLAHAVRNPRLLATPLPVPSGRRTIPYGVAMAIGLAVVAWFPRLLHLT